MTWTYDPSTDLGKVRLLSRETIESKSVLTDEDMQAFLDLESGSIRLAAANALEFLANTQELLLRKLTLTGALSTDGPAVAADLRGAAKTLRDQEYQSIVLDETYWDGMIDWAEMALTPAGAAEIFWNGRIRE